jgi:hypothetical protein
VIRHALAALLLSAGAAAAQPYVNAPGPVPVAPPGYDPAAYVAGCITAAGAAHRIPASLLVLIMRVENGRLGRVTPNASGAPPDVGPAQVNAMWVRRLAQRWQTTPAEAFIALRDNLCANLEAAAWILRDAIDSAPDDFWKGVAHYHSRTPHFRDRYLRLLRDQAMALLEQARRRPETAAMARADG